MKNEEFISQLQQLAEVEFVSPKTIKDNHETPQEPEEVIYNGKPVILTRAFNPTLGIKVKNFKTTARACSLDCGNIVENQIVEKRVVSTPEKHWRTRCVTCGKYVHPDGKTLIKNAATIQTEEYKWFIMNNR